MLFESCGAYRLLKLIGEYSVRWQLSERHSEEWITSDLRGPEARSTSRQLPEECDGFLLTAAPGIDPSDPPCGATPHDRVVSARDEREGVRRRRTRAFTFSREHMARRRESLKIDAVPGVRGWRSTNCSTARPSLAAPA